MIQSPVQFKIRIVLLLTAFICNKNIFCFYHHTGCFLETSVNTVTIAAIRPPQYTGIRWFLFQINISAQYIGNDLHQNRIFRHTCACQHRWREMPAFTISSNMFLALSATHLTPYVARIQLYKEWFVMII